MPLTELQRRILRLLAANRSPGSHLAGGAAIHRTDTSLRYSGDLDDFHDSEKLVVEAFTKDRALLEGGGYTLSELQVLPGFVQASVSEGGSSVRVEWARDSDFRFMPPIKDPEIGYLLHPVDLAVNKVLALAGREEPRDLLDTIFVHEQVLGLGALCWGASGKDPGFSPTMLVELLQAKGRITAVELRTLDLAQPLEPVDLKRRWLGAIGSAARFISSMRTEEVGCLYFHARTQRFIQPAPDEWVQCERRYGQLGGVIPQVTVEGAPLLGNADPQALAEKFRPIPPPPGGPLP